VIIDSNDRLWIVVSCAVVASAAGSYAIYAETAPAGPSGGSLPGLTYGVIGTAMLAFAGLLGARRRFPTLRLGRLQFWMRGHIWLGLVGFPLILFHAGFAAGGSLTSVLMLLLSIIVLSGILGVVLQQFIPRLMMEQVPAEIIYETAEDVQDQLVQTAQQRVESLKPKPDVEDQSGYDIVKEFFETEIKPFLLNPKRQGLLHTPNRAMLVFEHVGKLAPTQSHAVIQELQKIVQQRRELARQIKLHRILHGWLLVHVPLSAVFAVLTLAHAVITLRYR
jgi:hypothetical protein